MVETFQAGTSAPLAQAASMVVLRRDSVLLVERGRAPFQGIWSFPGGRSEPGEEAEATARRELLEETGLEVGPALRLGRLSPVPGGRFDLTVFAARAGSGVPSAGDDAANAEFVPFRCVLCRRLTPGAAGWVALALRALSAPPL